MNYRYSSETVNVGNYQVEITLFDGKLSEVNEIKTDENLIDCDLYVKSGDKFVKLEDYVFNELASIYGV